jgi:hypothetical protein
MKFFMECSRCLHTTNQIGSRPIYLLRLSFGPLSDPILGVLSDVSSTDEGKGASYLSDAAIAVEFGASPLILSRNVDDGAKNEPPVTGLLKSRRRS